MPHHGNGVRMQSFTVNLTTSYQLLSALLGGNVTGTDGFFRNRDGSDACYIAAGYSAAPSTNVGELGPSAVLSFSSLTTANTWVKGASALTLDLFFEASYTPVPES